MFIAHFDDPILTSLRLQTAVSTRRQSIQSHNFRLSSVPFRTIKLAIPNPQTGDLADITVLHLVDFWKLGEGGVDLI